MKTFSTPIKLSVSLAAFLLSQASFAAGTTATTIVSNTATISYSVGGSAQSDIVSDAAEFMVDRKVDLTVSGNIASTQTVKVAPSSERDDNTLTYTLKNEGNSVQGFSIDVTHFGSDQFDAGVIGATAGPQSAEECRFTVTPGGVAAVAATATAAAVAASPASPAIGNTLMSDTAPIVTLAADEEAIILVNCSMQNRPDVVDGDKSIIDVLATAVDGSGNIMVNSGGADVIGAEDIVLADGIAATGTDSGTTAYNAMHSAIQTYEIDAPMLTVEKTSTVISDPFNTTNPKRIPGAVVEYAITILNTSDSEATGLTITDVLTAALAPLFEVKFVAGSIKLKDGNNATATAVTGYTSATETIEVTGVKVPTGDLTTPGEAIVTFQVTIL